MKTIESVQVWYNGAETSATVLSAMVQNDNLQSSAMFQYQLMTEVSMPGSDYSYPMPVVTNSLTMSGQDYLDWDTNDYAYNWIAAQLNLTITGEYIPPVPPSPTV
jgi:hypothetical protein